MPLIGTLLALIPFLVAVWLILWLVKSIEAIKQSLSNIERGINLLNHNHQAARSANQTIYSDPEVY